MGTTSTYALRYPEPTDNASAGALAIRQLAEDAQRELQKLTDAVNARLVSQHWLTLGSAAGTGVSAAGLVWLTGVGHEMTLGLTNGVRYRVSARGHVASTVAGDAVRLRLGVDQATVRSTGYMALPTTQTYAFDVEHYVTGTGAAVRFQIGLERLSGTGTVNTRGSSTDPTSLHVAALGVPT